MRVMIWQGIDSMLESLYSLLLKSLLYTDEDVIVESCEFGKKLWRAQYHF